MAQKKYRVLRDLNLDGVDYKPDTVLVLNDKTGGAHEQAGALDSNKAAVAYAEEELGSKVVTHKAAAEETPEAPAA